jgi:hypothetical protein
MSENKDAEYPGQGGIGEAYAKLNEEKKTSTTVVEVSICDAERLMQQLTTNHRKTLAVNKQRDELDVERAQIIERLRHTIAPYR